MSCIKGISDKLKTKLDELKTKQGEFAEALTGELDKCLEETHPPYPGGHCHDDCYDNCDSFGDTVEYTIWATIPKQFVSLPGALVPQLAFLDDCVKLVEEECKVETMIPHPCLLGGEVPVIASLYSLKLVGCIKYYVNVSLVTGTGGIASPGNYGVECLDQTICFKGRHCNSSQFTTKIDSLEIAGDPEPAPNGSYMVPINVVFKFDAKGCKPHVHPKDVKVVETEEVKNK